MRPRYWLKSRHATPRVHSVSLRNPMSRRSTLPQEPSRHARPRAVATAKLRTADRPLAPTRPTGYRDARAAPLPCARACAAQIRLAPASARAEPRRALVATLQRLLEWPTQPTAETQLDPLPNPRRLINLPERKRPH